MSTNNNPRHPESRRPSGRRYRPEENPVTPAGLAIMAVVALVVVAVVLLVATGVFRVPQAQPGTTSSSEVSSVPEEVSSEEPVSSTVSLVNDPNVPYQSLYPELAIEKVEFTPRTEGDKVVYLTFNDAPGENTGELLQALAAANVKATFFVTAANMAEDECKAALKSIADAGHTIGIYTYSNDFDTIYASVEDYLADFKQCDDLIYAATGTHATLFRFPAGSGNNYYSGDLGEKIADEMLRRGYVYHDWNVDGTGSNDAAVVVDACSLYEKSVVLLSTTDTPDVAAAVSRIVEDLSEDGYRFAALDNTVKPFRFY